MANEFKRSPIFYMGNKLKLLPQIVPLLPQHINTFWDMFGGSGVVSGNIEADHIVYNELNTYIVEIFKLFKNYSADHIISYIEDIVKEFDLNPEGVNVRQGDPSAVTNRERDILLITMN